jgi:hypothetical protein
MVGGYPGNSAAPLHPAILGARRAVEPDVGEMRVMHPVGLPAPAPDTTAWDPTPVVATRPEGGLTACEDHPMDREERPEASVLSTLVARDGTSQTE